MTETKALIWGAVILACVALAIWFNFTIYPAECRAHGGSYVTYPYKELPACWTADGRRVLW